MFEIYNENDKFFFIDKELEEKKLIQKPEIIDFLFNKNIESILKNAQLFKRDNRLSCQIKLF